MIIDADLNSIDSGVWEDWDGSSFLIAHISNLKFQRALARHQQPHIKKIQAGTLDPKINRDITAKAMAEGIVLDWKNVKNSQGEDVPFSPEAAAKVLSRDPAFRDFVSEFAVNLKNYREEEMNELGNG